MTYEMLYEKALEMDLGSTADNVLLNDSKIIAFLLDNCDIAVCENSENLDYIDIMSALQDENYALAGQYCSDGFIHQENIAYDIWAEKLGAK